MFLLGRSAGNILGFILIWLLLGCQTAGLTVEAGRVEHTVPTSLRVPSDVERLAILYQNSLHSEEREAYQRLEGAVFQIKELRPSLKIIERSALGAILKEHQFQLGGSVAEETAIRVGRLLGTDSVLIYTIQGPTLRDRVFAEDSTDLPPFLVTSKIIEVESAEIVYHNVVTARIEGPLENEGYFLFSRESARPLMRQALGRGVDQTIADLRHAFR